MSSRLSLVCVEFGIQAILSRIKRKKEGKNNRASKMSQ